MTTGYRTLTQTDKEDLYKRTSILLNEVRSRLKQKFSKKAYGTPVQRRFLFWEYTTYKNALDNFDNSIKFHEFLMTFKWDDTVYVNTTSKGDRLNQLYQLVSRDGEVRLDQCFCQLSNEILNGKYEVIL